MKKLWTGFFDDYGKKIFEGDILQSCHNYKVKVVIDSEGHFVGKLICKPNHSCANIPYSLSDGRGHRVIKRQI
jgi:hypothetical protein